MISAMPWRLERFYGGGDLHFVTGSCYRRRPFLTSPVRRDLFLTVLEQVRQRYSFVVVGYVVMPEHFHLLISEPEKGDPSVVIQALKVGFVRRLMVQTPSAQRSPVEKITPANIWQRRFYDFNVWSKQKRIEKLRYIHRNPVKRGLVEKPEQWHWSSFRSYAYAEVGPVRVNDWTALKMKIRAA
jgi:putative transposase